MLSFSLIAALVVYLAGRSDAARDPRLTTVVLGLLAVFPVLLLCLPKVGIIPLQVPNPAGEHDVRGVSRMLVLSGLWISIAALGLARLVGLAWRLNRWHERSVLLRREGKVEIRRLDHLESPAAAGVFRAVIYVPPAWEKWSMETRRMVLDHEMAHHRRRDPLRRWIAAVACAVHAYNPLVRWIGRRLVVQCEFACDAMVLGAGARPAAYAKLLCDVAEERSHRVPAFAMAEKAGLESRIRRLMTPRCQMSFVEITARMVIVFCIACAMASARGQPDKEAISRQEVEMRWSANPFPVD